jgi:hypothetical protein
MGGQHPLLAAGDGNVKPWNLIPCPMNLGFELCSIVANYVRRVKLD